jgi:hypothetical protein
MQQMKSQFFDEQDQTPYAETVQENLVKRCKGIYLIIGAGVYKVVNV